MVYGYTRVSSKDQNSDRQIHALREYGVYSTHIYSDKQTGKNFARAGYQKLLGKLRPGDIVIIKSIDRLGRNYEEILDQWRHITKEKHVHIRVLDMPLLDTTKTLDLTGTFLADMVLQILSYVAEAEREFIRHRQEEGIAAAKIRGVRFGRKPMTRPENYEAVKKAWAEGRISARKAALQLKITHRTFLRWVRENG